MCFDPQETVRNAPSYINDLFVTNYTLHNRPTRHGSINLVCPKFQRTCDGGRTFTVSGIKLWNSIPADIRKTDNIQGVAKKKEPPIKNGLPGS